MNRIGDETDALAGERRDWEEAVFQNASYFTVCVLAGPGSWNRKVCATLPEATTLAAPLQRALVYAATEAGRYTVLPRQEWQRLLQAWPAHPANHYRYRLFQAGDEWYWKIGEGTTGPYQSAQDANQALREALSLSGAQS